MTSNPAGEPFEAISKGDVFGSGQMAERARAFDWSRTPLGPVEQWPAVLQTTTRTAFASSFPQMVLWGPELIQIYNDAYQRLLGARHPDALGQAAAECWADVWSTLGAMFHHVFRHGEPVGARDRQFVLHRTDYLEETYFTFSYSPIMDENRVVRGVLVTCFETTAVVIQEQRSRAISELATVVGKVQSLADAQGTLERVFSRHQHLLAFELIYLIDPASGGARRWLCSGLTGRPDIAPAEITLDGNPDAAGGCEWPVAQAIRSGSAVRIHDVATRFGHVTGPNTGEPVRSALVVPLFTAGQAGPTGVAVLGANPRRALDDAYAAFLEWIGTKITLALANGQAQELERRRLQELEARVSARTAELERANQALRAEMDERRRVDVELQRQSQRLAMLSRDLMNAQEHERRHIARELHDEIGQSLTLLKLGLQTAHDSPARTSAALSETEAGINGVLELVRNLSLDLRPALLDDLGLLPALLALVERFLTRHNLDCRFQHEGITGRRFSTMVETAAYRVAQEAITNVVRHAGVSAVSLKVWAGADRIQVRVEDEGSGFALASAMRSHRSTGLPGMRERMHLAGGELRITTAPRKGTCVIAELPLRAAPTFAENEEPGAGD